MALLLDVAELATADVVFDTIHGNAQASCRFFQRKVFSAGLLALPLHDGRYVHPCSPGPPDFSL